jgi:hypothetical protein
MHEIGLMTGGAVAAIAEDDNVIDATTSTATRLLPLITFLLKIPLPPVTP